MTMIEIEDGNIQVDATIVAQGLGIDPSLVQERMRHGKIITMYELGIDEDNGRHRLTFFSESRRLCLLVDEKGNVFQRSAMDSVDFALAVAGIVAVLRIVFRD